MKVCSSYACFWVWRGPDRVSWTLPGYGICLPATNYTGCLSPLLVTWIYYNRTSPMQCILCYWQICKTTGVKMKIRISKAQQISYLHTQENTLRQCPQIKLLYSCASFAINFLIVSFVPILPRALRNGIPSKLAHNTVVALNCHLLWRCWKQVPCLCRQVV